MEGRHSVQNRRKDIQGLRALAVLAVIIFHAGLPLKGGFVGVDVFFVISGFVITQMLVREWSNEGFINLRQFYIRRFKRLSPALALVVTTTAFGSIFLLSPLGPEVQTAALTGLGAVLMSANVIIALKTGGYFNVAATNNPFLNTWSLSVEEQFYVGFPVLLLTALIISRSRKRPLTLPTFTIFSVFLLSLAAALYGSKGTNLPLKVDFLLGFYSPFTRAWEFAAGGLLCFFQIKRTHRIELASDLFSFLGIFLVGYAFIFFDENSSVPGVATLTPVAGTVLLILSGSIPSGRRLITKFLSSGAMVAIGDVSYSWYLWHWPAIVYASAIFGARASILATAAGLSLIPALASFKYVENPLRGYRATSSFAAFLFPIAILAPPIAACLLVVNLNQHGYWSKSIKAYKAIMDDTHAAFDAGCALGDLPQNSSDQKCLWNSKGSNVPIYLVGDSNADHISEALIATALQLDSPLRILSKGGCSFLGRSWSDRDQKAQAECLRFVDGVKERLRIFAPGIVVLSISDSIWRPAGAAVGPNRISEQKTSEGIFRYLKTDLIETVTNFQNSGHKTLLVLPVPKFVDSNNKLLFDPSKCTSVGIYYGWCPEKVSLTIYDQDLIQHEARTAITNAATATRSRLIDLRPTFCPKGMCTNLDGDRPIYRDAGHLTVSSSNLLTDKFVAALSGMLESK